MIPVLRPWADQLWFQGVKFGTIGAELRGQRIEITTYREEWYVEDSRKPEVHFAPDIASDLSRRDFTVNAIAVRIPSGEVFDPTGGLQVLRHTFAVVEGMPPTLVGRLAALMHDIGKPATREFGPDGVSFHHHEVVGARMTEKRLKELRFPNHVIDDVRQLVFLHLRLHTY